MSRGCDLESRDSIALGTEHTKSTPKHLQCNVRKMKRDKEGGVGGNPSTINMTHNTLTAMTKVTNFADLVFLHEMLFSQLKVNLF